MNPDEQLEILKRNIISLSASTINASYMGLNRDQVRAIEFSVDKVLEGTGLTINKLLKEAHEKVVQMATTSRERKK